MSIKLPIYGDWIGELYDKLPEVDCGPNASPQELSRLANKYVV